MVVGSVCHTLYSTTSDKLHDILRANESMCSRHAGVNDTVNRRLYALPGNRVGRPTGLRLVASATMTSLLVAFMQNGALLSCDSFSVIGALLHDDSFIVVGALLFIDSFLHTWCARGT